MGFNLGIFLIEYFIMNCGSSKSSGLCLITSEVRSCCFLCVTEDTLVPQALQSNPEWHCVITAVQGRVQSRGNGAGSAPAINEQKEISLLSEPMLGQRMSHTGNLALISF